MRFNSLQTRITALFSLAFGLTMVLVATVMQWAISANADQEVRSELVSSAGVIDRVWSMREQELRGLARPLALDFGFREAVASGDDETIRSALDNIASRIDLPKALVVRYDGRVIDRDPNDDRARDEALWEELDSGWQSGALRLNGTTYQAVASEIKAPALIGWLVIGREIDAHMKDLSAVSVIPVNASVVRRAANGAWVFDGSGIKVPNEGIAEKLAGLTPTTIERPQRRAERMGGRMVLLRPLGTAHGQVSTVLMLEFSLAEALAEYDFLKYSVIAAGFIGLLLVIFASMWLARRIVRPIAALEAATRLIAKGERTHVAVASSDEIGALTGRFNEMSSAIVERESHISYLAYHDVLTGLPNRLCLREELGRMAEAAAREGGRLVVLCLGLDDFKGVNDTLGHETGDRLLVAVAHRLQDLAGDRFVARMGGDQFCLVSDAGCDADMLAADVIERLSTPFVIGEHRIRCGAGVGVVDAEAEASAPEDLIKHAELAMFRAKEAGPSRSWRFTPELDHAARHRRLVEADLHQALADGQFELYFQPLFDLTTNRFSAFEALVRWNHPHKGVVMPGEFITIAEGCGLIVPLGEWVLKDACRQAATWPEDIRVAVNISMVQFQSPGLMNTVIQALAASGLEPGRLEIEITESLFLEDSGAILKTLKGFKDLGVRIALDDFGTGYSSLSYLRKFPVDKIKIDRSFIIELLHEKEAGAVVRAITQLAAALDMETTAEGVEDPGQVEVLRAHGCTNVQGYYFSQPVPADRVLPLLAASGRFAERAAAGQGL